MRNLKLLNMKIYNLKNTTLFLAAAATILSFGSCSKDDDNNGDSNPVSKTTLLTTGGWVIYSNIEIQGPNTYDIFASNNDCDKDDILIFNKNSSITFDEGATKCNPSDPQTYTQDTWALVSNDTKLSITLDNGGVELIDIITLTSTEMTLQVTYDDPNSDDDIITTVSLRHN